MKVTTPNPKSKSLVSPPIPFEKPERKLKKEDHATLKLRSIPNDANSAAHEASMPHFKDGTPEELLEFFDQFDQVVAGQALTTGQQKFNMAKSLLEGEALSHWNHILQRPDILAQTDPCFEKAKKPLIAHVFPKKALRTQKRHMRRCSRKKPDVTIRQQHTRVVELNDRLAMFPNGRTNDQGVPLGFDPDQKLEDDELTDILEFGDPNAWQKKMIELGFDPLEEDEPVLSLVEFCERLETVEGMEANLHPNGKPKAKQSDDVNETDTPREKSRTSVPCCRLHGAGHPESKCHVLKGVIDELKKNKQHASNDVNARRDCAENNKNDAVKQLRTLVKSQGELLATLSEKLAKKSSKKRKDRSCLAALTGEDKKDPPVESDSDHSDLGDEEFCAAFQQEFDKLSVKNDDSDSDDE